MTVILAPEVMHILRRRRAEVAGAAYVFPGRGKAEHLIDPKTPWQRVVKRARLKDVTMHDLRRTLGSWQAMGGSGLPIIGKSLGRRGRRAPNRSTPGFPSIRCGSLFTRQRPP